MAKPTTKQQLIDYALRRNGAPVIDINIATEQLDDAIDDALDFFQEYHNDAQSHQFMLHELTQNELDTQKITLPDHVTAVTQAFNPASTSSTTDALFDVTYQLRLNDIWDASDLDITYWYISQEYISFVNDIITTNIRYEFDQYNHTVHMHADLGVTRGQGFKVGDYILFEVYTKLDPDVSTDLWGHWVLRDLAAAYVKRQWAQNLSKFSNMKLPGGVQMRGEDLFKEADEEINRIKEDFIMNHQGPDEFIMR